MKLEVRLGIFAAGAAGLLLLLVWGVGGLPPFGHYAGPYGDIVAKLVEPQRHMANAVTAVVFDYRGFDTMGEELILFAAAGSTALLLRETRDYDTNDIVDSVKSEGVRAFGVAAAIATLLLALYVVAHGLITPGGGFQGGVVAAAAFVLVFLTCDYRAYAHIASSTVAEPAESIGAAGYVVLGVVALALGDAFLENFLPLGVTGRLRSGGSAAIVNWGAAVAVAGGFLLIFAEYLEENMAARHGRDEP